MVAFLFHHTGAEPPQENSEQCQQTATNCAPLSVITASVEVSDYDHGVTLLHWEHVTSEESISILYE